MRWRRSTGQKEQPAAAGLTSGLPRVTASYPIFWNLARVPDFMTGDNSNEAPMGAGNSNLISRIIAGFARQPWRGWDEGDIASLARKLDDPAAYSGGIVKITKREYRAWAVLNRSILESKQPVSRAPLLAWVDGGGLYPMTRVTVAERPAADAAR
jgi:hypothetical protein